MQIRRILLGALSAPLLLLPACGGGDSVADPPVSSAPPSSDPTQPPKRESPEHFIRRWAAEDIQMQRSGNTTKFRGLSTGCRDCVALADRVESIYKAGGYIRTKGWSVTRVAVGPRSSGGFLAELHVISEPTHYRESAGAPLKSYPGGPAVYELRIARVGSSWNVTSLGRTTS